MKFRFFLLMLLPICMVGCNDEMDSLVKGPSEVAESITQMTRSISPVSIYDGEPVEFEPTQDMIRLKELYAEMHSTQRRAPLNPSPTYDETLWGNMYAIRELPATIKVRSKASTGSTANYVSLYCEGKSKEVTLNAGNAGDKNYSTTYNPDVRKPLCIRLDGFDENKMAFYADPKSNMRYIYDSSKKIAFAYNEDEEYGDYVLDYYGIRDWVESLPKRSTSMMILQNYTIIGL